MGIKQPKWDIYEAVVLLDGYLEMRQSKQPRKQIIRRISSDLRRMAVNRGFDIDEIFRNENGISYQIQSMESAYKGEKIYVPATKLFEMTVKMYHTDPRRYLEILEEAKSMIADKQNNKAAFLSWAASALPAQRCKWIEENLAKVEKYAVSSGLISGSLFDVSDTALLERIFRAIEKNKIFQLKNQKLIKNINADFRAYIQFCHEQSEELLSPTDKDSPVVKTPVKQLSIDDISNNLSADESPATEVSEVEFYQYLLSTAKLAGRTCASYISAIRSAERYAANNNYVSCTLLNANKETIIATATELYGDPDFIRYNEQQHNRFSAAINKLLEHIGADVPEKAAPSFGSSSKEQKVVAKEAYRLYFTDISDTKATKESTTSYENIKTLIQKILNIADDENDSIAKWVHTSIAASLQKRIDGE